MPETPTARDRLDSWKEIAVYIGRDIRTAMRWEKERGLPVHRVPGSGARQPVFAYRTELDEWLKRGNEESEATEPIAPDVSGQVPSKVEAVPPSRRHHWLKWPLFLGAIGLAAIFAVGMVVSRHHSATSPIVSIARIEFVASGIQAFDDNGHMVWAHSFPKKIHPEALKHLELYRPLVHIGDFSGLGDQEVLVTVPLQVSPNVTDIAVTEIDCFSSRGKLLWSYIPQQRFLFGDHDLVGPWIIEDVFVSPGPRPAIWAAFTHYRWGNSFIIQLDPATGSGTVRFVNTGIIYKLNETRIAGKQYLLIGGFNNEYAAGILAAMDESRPYAVSPQTAGTRHKCLNCRAGDPDYYFVFPKSEINRLYESWEDSIRVVTVQENHIEVDKAELGDPALGSITDIEKVHVVYEFRVAPAFEPYAFRFDSWYDIMHRDLHDKGKFDHDLDSCPERLRPEPVRLWTPTGGWTDFKLSSLKAANSQQ